MKTQKMVFYALVSVYSCTKTNQRRREVHWNAERWIAHAPLPYVCAYRWLRRRLRTHQWHWSSFALQFNIFQHINKVRHNSLVRHLRPVERWTIRVVADVVVKLLYKFKHTYTHVCVCASATEWMHGVYTARIDAHCIRSVAACTDRCYTENLFIVSPHQFSWVFTSFEFGRSLKSASCA